MKTNTQNPVHPSNAGCGVIGVEPLRLAGSPFESQMAQALHAAYLDGWGGCRDAEIVGDEAANDAFNQSSTLRLCLSIDHPATPAQSVPLGGGEVVRLKPLDWSEERQPNDDIRYTHVVADSGLGRFSIEWKGWKDHDTRDLYLDGEYVSSSFDLDTAKKGAEKYLLDVLSSVIAQPIHPQDGKDAVLPRITAEELSALIRFQECCDDGAGYDVSKTMMVRLTEIGLVRRVNPAGYHQITECGSAAILASTKGPT